MRGTGVDGEFDRRQQRFSAAAGADLARGDWAAEEWTDWLDELGRRDSAAIHHVLKDAVAPILARLRAVVAALDGMLVAKDDLNRLVVVSALAQQPLVLMGEPGTAKTALVTALAELMGVRRAE
ncbi:MAG: hypothetical protein HYU66_00595, partial [Armatimonadetes bacterium]|nr:hypothetical protein [Armatimonadota bacterium]